MATLQNLKDAFAGESQANRKYLAFAKKAEADGYKQVARLFRAAAEAETVHAHSHLRVMDGIKTTAENLQAAIAGEGAEFQEMYPKFVAEAKAEGNDAAVRTFDFALQVEEIHHGLYQKALDAVNGSEDLPEAPICICPYCGNTFVGDAPDKCPICGATKDQFVSIQ
ncbi:rubrerythrin family protein [Candidatus Sumerlaeota bacterium]|nr:rubrerythrin family protein [Candidatus Sumerlaeota bacterium]